MREAILQALAEKGATPEQALAPAMLKQLEKANEGDTQAIVFLRDSLDGRPAQQLELTGDAENPVVQRIEQVIVDADAK